MKEKIVRLLWILLIAMLIGCTPRATNPAPNTPIPTSTAQSTSAALTKLTATSMTFIAEADAQGRESDPYRNYGDSTELMVDGEDDLDVESFIRFRVTGITGLVYAARLRLYVADNPSHNSPAVYASTIAWDESTLTWSQRPTRISASLDDHRGNYTETWVEYDVSNFVTENTTYSFVLVADSDDAATFSSREGSHPPELAITLGDGPTATVGIPVTGATEALTASPLQGLMRSLTVIANMDARVKESDPDGNYGTSSKLQVDDRGDPAVESYIRFIVAEITGQVSSAHLRVYVITNGSSNGPALYATEPGWTELGITWSTRPARISSEVDNKDRVRKNRWIDYDVTSLIRGDGTYSFVLAADSSDAVNFSSREGSRPPQLVIMFHEAPTPTLTPTLSAAE